MVKMSNRLQRLLDKYPNLTGDELHCANCKHVVWCIKSFTQPTSDPEHKKDGCSFF
jgi:hypothetical protein